MKMNTKILALMGIAILAVAAVYVSMPKASTGDQATDASTGTATESSDAAVKAEDVSTLMSDEYAVLIQQELEKMSAEQPEFNSQVEGNIADDMSQFYYT